MTGVLSFEDTRAGKDGGSANLIVTKFYLYFGLADEDDFPWKNCDEGFNSASSDSDDDEASPSGEYAGALLLPKRGNLEGEEPLLRALGAWILRETSQGTPLLKVFEILNGAKYDKVFTRDLSGEMTEDAHMARSGELYDDWKSGKISESEHSAGVARLGRERSPWKQRQLFFSQESDHDIPSVTDDVFKLAATPKVALTNKIDSDTGGKGGLVLIIVPSEGEAKNLWTILAERKLTIEALDKAASQIDVIPPDDTSEGPSDMEVPEASPRSVIAPLLSSNTSPQQDGVAAELFCLAKIVLGEDLFNKFEALEFLIVGPRFTSLRAQTSSRLVKAGLVEHFGAATEKVIPHDISNYEQWKVFRELLAGDKNQKTLFVIVDDECHFGPTKKGSHDVLVNLVKSDLYEGAQIEEAVNLKNVLVLQVSATPQNCLTDQSQIQDSNIVHWHYDAEFLLNVKGIDPSSVRTSLYRSLDWTFESFLWRLAESERAQRTIVFINAENEVVTLESLDEKLDGIFFAQFDFADFAKAVEAVFKNDSRFMQMEFRIDKDDRLCIRFPAKGWRLMLNAFTRDLLGFDEVNAKIPQIIPCDDRRLLVCGQRSPQRLCDPAEGGCIPRAYQHVRYDESVQMLVKEWKEGENKKKKMQSQTPPGTEKGEKRTNKGRTSTANKAQVSPNEIHKIEYKEAHLLVADYVISMAYFAYFRLMDEFSPFVDQKPKKTRPIDGPVLVPKILIPDDHTMGQRVTAMLAALEKVKKDCHKWRHSRAGEPELAIDLDEALALVMRSFSQQAREEGLSSEPDGSEGEDVNIWCAIMKEKLWREQESLKSNDPSDWYTESDRLIKTLLDVDAPREGTHRKGFMTFTRIHGTDRSHVLQRQLREIMKLFGLYYGTEGQLNWRPIFAVVSDNGDVKLRDEIKKERWSDVALDSNNDTVEKRFESQKLMGYEMLGDVPCLVLLCAKGRMGDTFPQSLRLIDVRARAAGNYTTMIQEFGRVCRYPKLDDTWYVNVDGSNSFRLGGKESLSLDGMREELKRSMAKDHPVAFFRPRMDGPAPKSNNPSDFAMFSSFQGQAECENQLDALLYRVKNGDIFLRYTYPLPSLLISLAIANVLTNAVQLRNQAAATSGIYRSSQDRLKILRALPRLTACVTLEIDQYMERPQQTEDGNKPKRKKGVVLTTEVFRKHFTPTEKHYDHERANMGPSRLLLFAECQMGKTGVFLEFLQKLKKHCEETKMVDDNGSRELLPKVVPSIPVDAMSDYFLPCWTKLYPHGSLEGNYMHPKDGQYHSYAYVARWRLCREVSDDAGAYCKEARQRECILSNVGRTKLNEMSRTVSRTRASLVDWDGKLSALCTKFDADPAALGQDIPKWSQELQPVGTATRHHLSAGIMGEGSAEDGALHIENADFKLDDGRSIPFRIAYPSKYASLEDLKATAGPPWVFVPSHNRAKHASLDYSNTLEADRVVVVVCREGEQFAAYCKAVGHKLTIVAMPLEFDFEYPGYQLQIEAASQATGESLCFQSMKMKVTARDHKIGHARLFIQLLARKYFRLSEIWMLDDNIISCFDRLKHTELNQMRCRFQDVMQDIELVLMKPLMDIADLEAAAKGNLERKVRLPQGVTICPNSHDALPFPRHANDIGAERGRSASKIVEFSGHRDNYGVLGIARPDQFGRNPSEGFIRPTHSLYSLFLLNLKALEDKRVYWPAKPWMEDIEFMHCVHESGLGVLRSNRFFYTKNYPRPSQERSPLIAAYKSAASHYVFEWKDFDVNGESDKELLDRAQDLRESILDDPRLESPKQRVLAATLSFIPEMKIPLETQWEAVIAPKIQKVLAGYDTCLLIFSPCKNSVTKPKLLEGFQDATEEKLVRMAIATSGLEVTSLSRTVQMGMALKASAPGTKRQRIAFDAAASNGGAVQQSTWQVSVAEQQPLPLHNINPPSNIALVRQGNVPRSASKHQTIAAGSKSADHATKVQLKRTESVGLHDSLAPSETLTEPDTRRQNGAASGNRQLAASELASNEEVPETKRQREDIFSKIAASGALDTSAQPAVIRPPSTTQRSTRLNPLQKVPIGNVIKRGKVESDLNGDVNWKLEFHLEKKIEDPEDSSRSLEIIKWRVFRQGQGNPEACSIVESEDEARTRQLSGKTILEKVRRLAIESTLSEFKAQMISPNMDDKLQKRIKKLEALNEHQRDRILGYANRLFPKHEGEGFGWVSMENSATSCGSWEIALI